MLKMVRDNLGEIVVWRCAGAIVRGEDLDLLQETIVAEPARHIILDLDHVEAVDAAGLGELVYLYHWSVQQGIEFAITNLNPRVRALMELTNLDTILPIEGLHSESVAQVPLHAA